jgi:hypothetical protein
MRGITCEQAALNIDLLAAEACDARSGAETTAHLASCPACEAKYRRSRELMGLLDLRLRERESLQRLWSGVGPQSKRRSARVLAFPRRFAAVAALLLAALGLSLGLRPDLGGTFEGGMDLRASLDLAAPKDGNMEHSPGRIGEPPDAPAAVAKEPPIRSEYRLEFGGLSAADYLRAAQEGRLPPVEVGLSLDLHNDGDQPMRIDLDDDRASLRLDLRGPGALAVPAPPGAKAPLNVFGAVALAPGDRKRLVFTRLVDGARGAVRHLYWTKPGDYTLTAEVQAPVETDPLAGRRMRTFSTAPLRIHVVAK